MFVMRQSGSRSACKAPNSSKSNKSTLIYIQQQIFRSAFAFKKSPCDTLLLTKSFIVFPQHIKIILSHRQTTFIQIQTEHSVYILRLTSGNTTQKKPRMSLLLSAF